MQIVIEISDKIYEKVKEHYVNPYEVDEIGQAILDGTILPKHHGRLIDADALNFNANYNEPLIHKQDIDFAPTIIEGSESE